MEIAWSLFLLPFGLGLLGFLEPCSIGANLLFLKSVEGNPPRIKITQAAVFTLTRAMFLGTLGAIAALAGTLVPGLHRFGYVLLGSLYVALGVVYLLGKQEVLMRRFGPSLAQLSTVRGSAALAMIFGLNIPACSGPLLAIVLGSAAVAGAGQVAQGFWTLSLFGLALSLPLLVAVAVGPAERIIERLGRHARQAPLVVGAMLLAIGVWSVWFGLTVPLAGA